MQEVLVQAQQSQPTTWLEPSLPAKLEELLMGNEILTIGPKSAEILQEFLDAAKPPMADRKQIEVMIAKLALATASQKRSVDEEAERLELYWLTLRIYPLVDLRNAFLKLLRSAKFMPTPAEIDSVVQDEGYNRRRKINRAKHLLTIHYREYMPPKEYVTAEELAELRRNLNIGEGL